MNFIINLPTVTGINTIFTCIDKHSKYTRLILCFMGEGSLLASEFAKIFSRHLVR